MADSSPAADEKIARRLIWIVPASLTPTLHINAFNEPAHELARLGWDVTLLAQGGVGEILPRDFRVRYLPMPRVYVVGQLIYHLFVMADIAKNWKSTDVVYFHQESALFVLPMRVLRWLIPGRFPLLVMDTRTVEMVVDTPKARLRDIYRRLMNRFANLCADGQTAITRRLAEYVGIVPSDLLGIWPSGANRELFGQAIKWRQWPDESQPLPIIYIGSLYKERNVMAFCRAVVAACEKGMNFSLTVVGGGDEFDALSDFAKASKGRVRVLPSVPHAEVPRLLSGACIGVLPFPDEEKFRISSPIKLFEYMAAGMAIIATRIDCHTDVVGGEDFVFWADGSDDDALLQALARCWDQRGQLRTLGYRASEVSANWTWAASAQRISEALMLGLRRAGCA